MRPKFIKFLLKDKVINLDINELCSLINLLSDSEKNMDIFHYLSKSDFALIRSKVASMENLHVETIQILLNDQDPQVLKSIIKNESFMELMNEDDLEDIIEINNPEIMISIIENLNKLTDTHKICEKKWLYDILLNQNNPDVRLELILNDRTPKFVLEKIAKGEFRKSSHEKTDNSESLNKKIDQFENVYSNLKSSMHPGFFRSTSIGKMNHNGKVRLPKRFLKIIINESDSQLILTKRDGCIHAYTLSRWKSIESDFTRRLGYSKGTRLFRTIFISSAFLCKIINSNQIEIPQYLIEYAKLHKKIYFVGNLTKFEIWDEEKWNKENEMMEDELSDDENDDIRDLI